MGYQKKLTRKPRTPIYTKADIQAWLKEHRKDITILHFDGRVSGSDSKFKCKKCGHIWYAKVTSIKMGCGCPECCNKHKYTPLADIKEWFKKNLPTINVEYYTGLVNDNTSIFSCKKCGHIWSSSVAYLKSQKKGCPKCYESVMWKQNAEEWLKKHIPTIKVIQWGETRDDESVFKCKKCGYVFKRTYKAISKTKASGCLKCNKTTARSLDMIEEWLREHKPNIEVVNYCGACRYPSVFRCKRCGKEWTIAFQALQKTQSDCPYCYVPKGRLSKEEIKKLIDEKGIDIIKQNPEKRTAVFKCRKCGRVWETKPLIVAKSMYGCLDCKNEKRAYTKEQMQQWLDEHKPHIKIVKYGGKTMAQSTFRCTKCNTEWVSSMFSVKQSKYACPNWREHKEEENV